MKHATVSIIVPVYNAERYLGQTLISLLTQSYKNIEIIAIDDKSSDGSFKILSKFKKYHKQLRVYRNKKRYGLAICLNRGVRRAKGTFITFTNNYDVSLKNRIAKQVSFLQKNPKYVAVGTQVRYLNESHKKLGISTFPIDNDTIYHTMVQGSSLQFESVLINRTMLPKDILKFTGNSYPYTYSAVFMRLFPYGQFANVEQALYYHRKIEKTAYSKLSRFNKVLEFGKVLLKSIAEHEYRPSFTTLLFPQLKQA